MTDSRVPPHSAEAESAFLGSILLDPGYGIDKASELGATAAAFYDRRNQCLFNALQGMNGSRTDAVLIAQELQDAGLLEKIGGYVYLDQLQAAATVSAHMESYWQVIEAKYTARRLIEAAQNAQNAAYDNEDPTQTARALAEELEGLEPPQRFQMSTAIDEAAKELDAIANGEIVSLPFPWEHFQRATFGIPLGAVTPLLGRDKTGKSRLVMYLVKHWITAEKPFPTLVFAFEDGKRRYLQALAATIGGYDSFSIRRNPSPHYRERCRLSLEALKQLPVYIIDEPKTAEEIAVTISTFKKRHGIKAVVIDGFKDILASKGENRTGQENHIFETVKRAALKNEVGVLQIEHPHDIEDGIWLSRRNIRGSKQRSHSARMFLVYQDQGIPETILHRYGIGNGEGYIVLDCQAASYGERSYVVLKPELERGTFEQKVPISKTIKKKVTI